MNTVMRPVPGQSAILLADRWKLGHVSEVGDKWFIDSLTGDRTDPSIWWYEYAITTDQAMELSLNGGSDIYPGDECTMARVDGWVPYGSYGLVLDRRDGEILVSRMLSNGVLIGPERWIGIDQRLVVPHRWLLHS